MILAEVLGALPPISLPELNAQAALMNRVDRKYFVPRDTLAELIAALGTEARILRIAGRNRFRYWTVYLDTERFDFFRQHVQRRRHRFKVRTRTYCDSGGDVLEVKTKGARDLTVKHRIAWDPAVPWQQDEAGQAFVSRITGMDAAQLRPVLHTLYRRSTLVLGDQRITLDADLEFGTAERRITGPDDILVETKTPAGASDLDRMLVRAGIRPHRVSKYCLAASILYPQLPGNDWARLRRTYWSLLPPTLDPPPPVDQETR
ncbi:MULTISPECIES: polyphosphate polymerase domain-containing protein [Microbacterium]|uniref:polyphosphate polymerase domain-containing protein n=1 Tax=Microbacterium TaxID=33882 RepID=UPI00217CDA16|nr:MULTISPECIES: polyphosphate polymerase domain-containing protein [Microbacterium]UWF76716.1 polyphosphate polymerase domain-containing protein [Microbacterium neungamense]WCM54866.1 polyphosphate polymerase domain-containing protein [Microbacterium sp. EF45047]